MRSVLRIVLSVGLILPAIGFAQSTRDPSPYLYADEAALDRRIEDLRVEHGIPGVAVVVRKNSVEIFASGQGLSDREARRPVEPDTVFAIASVTKPLTATAVMMLVDEGKIDVDAPVNNYLGDDRVRATFGNESEITVARVMTHRAGLPFVYALLHPDEGDVRPSFSALMAEYGYTVLPVEETSRYSNLGYEILAEIVRRQSGLSYEQFLEERIFRPLGLDTAMIATGPGLPEGAAQRYMANGAIVPPVDTGHPGAANAYMSARDLARFGQFWLDAWNGRSALLSRTSARFMAPTENGAFVEGPGHGFFLEDNKGAMNVMHGGAMAGTKTRLSIFPTLDLVVAVALNQSNERVEWLMLDEALRSFAPTHMFYSNPASVPEGLSGRWLGAIGGNVELAELHADFTQRDRPVVVIDGLSIPVRSMGGDGPYNFRLDGELDRERTGIGAHSLWFELVERDGELVGGVRLIARPRDDRQASGRSYWVRLSRDE